MQTTTVKISSRVVDRVKAQKPEYIGVGGEIARLVEIALDNPNIMGGAQGGPPSMAVISKAVTSKAVTSKAVTSNACALPVEQKKTSTQKPKDPFSAKAISADLIPDDLKKNPHLDELLIDFWHIKKGTRSERAFNGLVTKLRAMTPSDQIKALQEAYNGGWATVYEPKPDTPKQGKWNQPEPETKHPAYKVFKASEQGAEWNVPSATGGKGVLDPGALDQVEAEACPF